MKAIIAFITSIFLLFFNLNVFAAGDDENIAKLSSFKKTGTEAGEVIAQNTNFADNVKKNIISIV